VALSWTASTGATGYNVQRSTTTGGPYTVIGTAAGASYTDTTATNGTTYYYVISATLGAGQSGNSNQASATPAAPVSAYSAWAANPTQSLTAGDNDGPMDDPDHDGILNLMEFALGDAPMIASQSKLPTQAPVTGGNWTFTYDRSVASRPPATTQIVEYGDDLSGWTPVIIPQNSATNVAITNQGETDRIVVTLAPLSTKGFVRLKVSQ
jgi:hypothetical protein